MHLLPPGIPALCRLKQATRGDLPASAAAKPRIPRRPEIVQRRRQGSRGREHVERLSDALSGDYLVTRKERGDRLGYDPKLLIIS